MKMEYTEAKALNLELRKTHKERLDKKFIRKIYEHKWISLITFSVIILSSINAMMIYNFLKILQNF